MYWQLTKTLTATIAADTAILLDIRADRYARLPRQLNTVFVGWLRDGPDIPMPESCRAALSAQRLLPLHSDGHASRITMSIPARMDHGVAGRWSTLAACGVAAHVLKTRRALRIRSFQHLLEDRARRMRAVRPHGADATEATARARLFFRVRPYTPVARVCLLDSLALLSWLGDAAGAVQLVFGVTAFPFGAHCWVQTPDRLLDQDADAIARYAPILHLAA